MKNNIIKLIIGIFATGTVATVSAVTTTKIIENKKEENVMTKEVQSTNIENQVENTVEPENTIENIADNSIKNTTKEYNNDSADKESSNMGVAEKQPVTSTQPVQTPKVEQEKEVLCTINVKQYAKDQHWEEGVPQKVELMLEEVSAYQNSNIIDFNNITVSIKGKGTKSLVLILNGGVVRIRDVNFNTQTSIEI